MFKNIMTACLVVLVICAFNPKTFGKETQKMHTLTLALNGNANATIVIAPEATKAAQFAAFELRYHLNRITGGDFPIATNGVPAKGISILVGDSGAIRALKITPETFKPQEYLIRFLPETIVLAGRDKADYGEVNYDWQKDPNAYATWPDTWDEQGTMYAVYDFLERFCNIRWFDHTEAGADIPEAKTLVVKGKDVRRAPAFRYRHVPCRGLGNIYDAYVSLWPRDSEGFRRWEEAAYAAAHKSKAYTAAKQACVQLFRHRMREGGEKCLCNHSLYHYYDLYWAPRPGAAEYFVGKRPELFAQGYEGDRPPQMCYTSAELIELVAQEARDYFDKGGYPYKAVLANAPRGMMWGANFFAVEPMDNSLFCKCPKCRELLSRGHSQADNGFYSQGTHSDYFFNFVNEVAKRVRKTHPDKWVVTLAYMTHAYPPESLRLEPNVAVQFCFASNRRPAPRGEYENEIKALSAWAEEARTSGRPLYLWLYYTFPVFGAHNGKYHCFPGFFAHTIGEQFRLFDQYGYRGMFHCGYGQEVESYVTYKLMDDPTLSVDVLLDDYFNRLYGAAGAPLKQLYLGIERAYSNPENYPKDRKNLEYAGAEVAWKYLGTAARMAEWAKLMQQAKALAKTDLEKRRVALFELGTWNYMVEGRKKYVDRMAAPIPSVTAPRMAEAGGDPAKVDWTKAAALGGPWHNRGQDRPAVRKFSGRLAHDGKYLYMELTDPCETGKLVAAPMVSCFDDWELFSAAQRGLPYRQFMVGPTGKVVALLNGEVNWRMYVDFPDHGLKVAADTSAPDKWVTRMAIPLKNLVKGGVAPGGKFYLNVVRVSAPALTPPEDALPGGIGIDTWVSHCTVHETDRLAEIRLE